MFSGLTNQVTSWMGAVKGEPQDEEVPPPPPGSQTESAVPVPAAVPIEQSAQDLTVSAEGEQAIAEGDEAGQKSGGMFSNVKSQMTGWLGSASASIPAMPAMPSMPSMPAMPSMPSIPGLRKGGAGDDGTVGGDIEPNGGDLTGIGGGGEDDDKSRYISATEGADSHPASGGGSPTAEGEAGHIGQVTTKVTQGAKTFGSFLYSAVNKAGTKIKETAKANPILDSFNKEQDAFIKGQTKTDAGAVPWIGHANEEKVKEEILALSEDRRNFVRAPPAGVDFEFNYDISYPVAIAMMSEDSALEKMRFELVPKIITEENFWRNYFYRVSLICKAGDLGTLGTDGTLGQASSEDVKKNIKTETNSNSMKNYNELVEEKNTENENFKLNEEKSRIINKKNYNEKNDKKLIESEFVSKNFQTTENKLLDDGIRKLGIDTMTQENFDNEEQWEKDLEAELQEYEVVNDRGGGIKNSGRGGGGGGSSSNRNSDITSTASTLQSSSNNNDAETTTTTITNIRNRSNPSNDWEEYADLIDETDDLK